MALDTLQLKAVEPTGEMQEGLATKYLITDRPPGRDGSVFDTKTRGVDVVLPAALEAVKV